MSQLALRLPPALTRLQRRLRQAQGEAEDRPGYFPVLMSLLDRGTATVSQLASQEGVRPPSMTVLLGQMESDGLIRKGPLPSDRRCVQVSLTPRGAATARRARQQRLAWLTHRLGHLGRSELLALERALPALEHLVGVPV